MYSLGGKVFQKALEIYLNSLFKKNLEKIQHNQFLLISKDFLNLIF